MFSFPYLFLYSGLHWIGQCPLTLGTVIYFIESVDSNTNSVQKHTHLETMFNLAAHGLVKLTRKINHCSPHRGLGPPNCV
jgi:hypothetical protein